MKIIYVGCFKCYVLNLNDMKAEKYEYFSFLFFKSEHPLNCSTFDRYM